MANQLIVFVISLYNSLWLFVKLTGTTFWTNTRGWTRHHAHSTFQNENHLRSHRDWSTVIISCQLENHHGPFKITCVVKCCDFPIKFCDFASLHKCVSTLFLDVILNESCFHMHTCQTLCTKFGTKIEKKMFKKKKWE